MGRFCESCPLFGLSDEFRICSDPPVECRDALDERYEALQTRENAKDLMANAKEGIIPVISLQEGDELCFFTPDDYDKADKTVGDTNYYNPSLFVKVTEVGITSLAATVLEDISSDGLPPDHPEHLPTLQPNIVITIEGAYDNRRNKLHRGELHRGRDISYYTRAPEDSITLGPIHEIIITRGQLTMKMFNTTIGKTPKPPRL